MVSMNSDELDIFSEFKTYCSTTSDSYERDLFSSSKTLCNQGPIQEQINNVVGFVIMNSY